MEQIKDYLARPSMIIEDYPEIKEAFTPNEMGTLLTMKLIRGRKLRRGCEVSVKDVLKLLQYRREIKVA